jgi:hypothetical protein
MTSGTVKGDSEGISLTLEQFTCTTHMKLPKTIPYHYSIETDAEGKQTMTFSADEANVQETYLRKK